VNALESFVLEGQVHYEGREKLPRALVGGERGRRGMGRRGRGHSKTGTSVEHGRTGKYYRSFVL